MRPDTIETLLGRTQGCAPYECNRKFLLRRYTEFSYKPTSPKARRMERHVPYAVSAWNHSQLIIFALCMVLKIWNNLL